MNGGEEPRRKYSPRELLDLREQSWAPRLRRVSLVAEANIEPRHSDQVALALAARYRKLPDPRQQGARFLARWPACVAAAMAGAAASEYRDGTFWPAFWRVARYQEREGDQAVWGDAFARALDRLHLPAFPDLPWRYVGPILMHAGIPNYCLYDYFQLLLTRRRQDPGMDAESFMSWATVPGRTTRLSSLHVPAQRFLTNGGDYALDVVDRTLDLLQRLSDKQPDLDGVGLPARIVEEAQSAAQGGELDLAAAARTRRSAGSPTQSRPRIALDPFGQGVMVVLPAIGEAPDGIATWRVTADGEPATVRSQALWVGAAEAAPETAYPLPRPVRNVRVSLVGWNHESELQVVETADPIVFFAEDGRRLPATLPLPPEPIWVLQPADQELTVNGEIRVVAEGFAPMGWVGWRLRLISLERASAVALPGKRSHLVRGQARPRLLLEEPIPGVTTPYGSPVYANPPLISVPGGPESSVKWRIEIHASADGVLISSLEVEGPGQIDAWQSLPRPLLGAFDITVRGPLGRGMRRTIFVAEGLRVKYQPAVRGLMGNGLKHGAAHLSAGPGSSVHPESLRFAADERARMAEYRAGNETEPIVVTPPHAAVLCTGMQGSAWATAPLRLETESIGQAGRLLVRLPQQDQPGELEVWVGGERKQAVPASGPRSAGMASYELARISETVAEYGRAELMFSQGTVLMPVAFVRPRRVASGVRRESDRLTLRDYVHVDGLMAGVYLVFAPWRLPEVLPVSIDGNVVLPQSLQQAGPMLVKLQVEDPWTTTGWPEWPLGDAFNCPGPGIPSAGDAEEDSISRFLAGDGGLPAKVQRLDRLWWILRLDTDLIAAGARLDLRTQCTAALLDSPDTALAALGDAGLDPATSVVALIRTGFAALRPPALEDPDNATRLWALVPPAAAILTSRLLERADGDSGVLAKVLDEAVARCGESLRNLLEGRDDGDAVVGRFEPQAETMAAMSKEQVDALWQAAAVVPAALLDTDTRTAAARRLFDARQTPPLKRLSRDALTLVKRAERLLRMSDYEGVVGQVTARQHPEGKGGWLCVPALSAAMALIARVAARGDRECQSMERQCRELWADLAFVAPDLTTIDLILAEALVAGAEGWLLKNASAYREDAS